MRGQAEVKKERYECLGHLDNPHYVFQNAPEIIRQRVEFILQRCPEPPGELGPFPKRDEKAPLASFSS